MTIPARDGVAAQARAGSQLRVVNTHGTQVVDFWAFNAHDMDEFMSMPHVHTDLASIIPAVGDRLVTNRRRPILTLLEDTSPGIHDTLIAACDPSRYELLGVGEYHDNCQDNLRAALWELGLVAPETPSPLNLFMNIPWKGNEIAFEESPTRPGDYVVFRAEMTCVVAFSACPQDMVPINGVGCTPTEAHFQVG